MDLGSISQVCAVCKKNAYAVERVVALDKTFHKACLRCNRCKKVLTIGKFYDHDGQVYCQHPCYGALFGPGGYGRGGVGSAVYENGDR